MADIRKMIERAGQNEGDRLARARLQEAEGRQAAESTRAVQQERATLLALGRIASRRLAGAQVPMAEITERLDFDDEDDQHEQAVAPVERKKGWWCHQYPDEESGSGEALFVELGGDIAQTGYHRTGDVEDVHTYTKLGSSPENDWYDWHADANFEPEATGSWYGPYDLSDDLRLHFRILGEQCMMADIFGLLAQHGLLDGVHEELD